MHKASVGPKYLSGIMGEGAGLYSPEFRISGQTGIGPANAQIFLGYKTKVECRAMDLDVSLYG